MSPSTLLAAVALLSLTGCKGTTPADPKGEPPGDTGPVVWESDCADAAARLGYPACEPAIPDDDTFNAVTIASSSVDQLRVGKYLVPAVDDARVPPVFLYVDPFALHYEFLITAFPDVFPGLQPAEYESMVLYPESREFYAGTLSLYLDGDTAFYGFTVWDDPSVPESTVTVDDVTEAWSRLQERFDVGELWWVPNTAAQTAAAATWSDTPFQVAGLSEVEYEAYNPGEAYGTLRLYTLEEFEAATEEAAYGYQDILVIDQAPVDIERVVSGMVTGTRQGDLSHLNVRSTSRGTPNCYVALPLEELADWADQLVRFECGETDWSVAAATQEDAEAWWASIRPDPVTVCPPELGVTEMPGLLEVDTSTKEARLANNCAFGAKGANLATLNQRIDAQWTFPGFLVPFHYYIEFVNNNGWTVDLGAGEAEYTYADTLTAWHADPDFLTDALVRRDRLAALRASMTQQPLDPALVDMLVTGIREVWGSDEVMVRFRSSSNAEDSFEFSGAGLYESESACAADELDDDDVGPSICDSDKAGEESLQEAVTNVWASLWYMAAWDERDWYGMDQSEVAMGILVNSRSKLEQSSSVAFTGNPTSDGDDRYLVNAQAGELDVVSAEPGVTPEKVLMTVTDGVVVEIERVSPSSEVEAGQVVLSDAQLSQLGEVLAGAAAVYPVDGDIPEGKTLIWDTEWKVLNDGSLVIKQIRPFTR